MNEFLLFVAFIVSTVSLGYLFDHRSKSVNPLTLFEAIGLITLTFIFGYIPLTIIETGIELYTE